MRRGVAVSAVFALLLCVSLGAKFAAAFAQSRDDVERLTGDLVHRMRLAGLDAEVEQRPMGLIAVGRRGSCRIIARNGQNWSSLDSAFAKTARPFGELRYIYRGRRARSAPSLRPALDRLGQRLLSAFGGNPSRPALLAVAASSGCGAIDRLFDGINLHRQPPADIVNMAHPPSTT